MHIYACILLLHVKTPGNKRVQDIFFSCCEEVAVSSLCPGGVSDFSK